MSEEKHSYTVQANVILNKQPIFGVNSIFAGKEKEYPETEIGEGTIICSNSIIYAGSKIGKRVFIGDGASIREGCTIEDEVMIGRNAIVECNTIIRKKSVIQTRALITADVIIGEGCFIGPDVCTMNDRYMGMVDIPMEGPTFEDGCRVGGNCSIFPGVTIGKNAVISAGSVIDKNVPPEEVWRGNPAKCVMKRKWLDKMMKAKEIQLNKKNNKKN
ncbi:2,3,4,5-tetrahydropyridine-2,6-dicarboxylate N-acetyltransferase [Candidatus Lokiarchaeum ossiferum]|uniref:2,3,4,5-tetrahydropyridine-2,6-dicarboxylate N-acetyltransferase n=1 Tax=Candidatus Lokiarchaeum ossiferum TaxID=2951803 RepID=A0ABY6HVG8_9ARCH|nr:2,3,4,5-tetrahydropyridine-2,6-dicarboxylate N-acetyltransferase [Candidatus Lokiarchaeum sp. B-35]